MSIANTITFGSFAELSAELSKGRRISNIELTPVLAADIIKQHKANRAVRRAHVFKLASAILEGYWNNNPASQIYFFRGTMRLADGQHRCEAVIRAGKSIIVDVIPDVDSMVGHDEGANRTVADHLMMEGIENAGIVSRVAKALFVLSDNDSRAGNAAILQFFKQERAFCLECTDAAIQLTKDIIPSRLILTSAQVAVARARMIREAGLPADKTDEFLQLALNGVESDTASVDLYKVLSGRTVKPLTSDRIIQMCLIAAKLYNDGKRGRVENMRWQPKAAEKKKDKPKSAATPELFSGVA